jgi:hypothetical protein
MRSSLSRISQRLKPTLKGIMRLLLGSYLRHIIGVAAECLVWGAKVNRHAQLIRHLTTSSIPINAVAAGLFRLLA